jgi:CheY-like chemotaxis protein
MPTVRVVDDEFGVAEVLELILEDEGYRVFSAANGRQGLERLREVAPDLVILDFMMPILDGPGTLDAIRGDPDHVRTPVVMMSSMDEVTVRGRCNGYQSFLHKPFRVIDVIAAIAKAVPNDPDQAGE